MLVSHFHVLKPFRIADARLRVTVTSRLRVYEEIIDALYAGDQLVHRADNGNSLAVYRGGELLGVATMTALGMTVMMQSGWITSDM